MYPTFARERLIATNAVAVDTTRIVSRFQNSTPLHYALLPTGHSVKAVSAIRPTSVFKPMTTEGAHRHQPKNCQWEPRRLIYLPGQLKC